MRSDMCVFISTINVSNRRTSKLDAINIIMQSLPTRLGMLFFPRPPLWVWTCGGLLTVLYAKPN